jgi:hypothetical protein
MHAFVIMHNMIIESKCGDPAARNDHMYDHQGPLVVVDN